MSGRGKTGPVKSKDKTTKDAAPTPKPTKKVVKKAKMTKSDAMVQSSEDEAESVAAAVSESESDEGEIFRKPEPMGFHHDTEPSKAKVMLMGKFTTSDANRVISIETNTPMGKALVGTINKARIASGADKLCSEFKEPIGGKEGQFVQCKLKDMDDDDRDRLLKLEGKEISVTSLSGLVYFYEGWTDAFGNEKPPGCYLALDAVAYKSKQ